MQRHPQGMLFDIWQERGWARNHQSDALWPHELAHELAHVSSAASPPVSKLVAKQVRWPPSPRLQHPRPPAGWVGRVRCGHPQRQICLHDVVLLHELRWRIDRVIATESKPRGTTVVPGYEVCLYAQRGRVAVASSIARTVQ